MKYAIPAVPAGLSPALAQWCQGVNQALQVMAGMLGPESSRAVLLGEVSKLTGASAKPASGEVGSLAPGQYASIWLPAVGTWTLMAVTGSGGNWSGMVVWTGGVGGAAQPWGSSGLSAALQDSGEVRVTNLGEAAVSLKWTLTGV